MGSFGRVVLGLSTAGISEAVRKKDKPDENPAAQAPGTPAADPAAVNDPNDPEKQRRIGRAALITTSSRGVLGNATTSNKKLSV